MLRKNIIANYLGRIWPNILNFALAPVFLNYLSVEEYGLVGLFVSLQAVISFLDLGLSTTANREVAIGLTSAETKQRTCNLVHTFELIYVGISFLIAICFFFLSDWLAGSWIKAELLSFETLRYSVIVFGVTLALRWPVALYNGVLQGSENQVLNNLLAIVLATLRTGGAIFVVFFLSNTILAYLNWQLVVAIIELIMMRIFAWVILRGKDIKKTTHDFSLLHQVWKFSISISFNSLLAALLKQMDRFLITNLLLLQQVGYYSTANVVYTTVSMLAFPISSAAFPRFASLIALKDNDVLAATYHKLSQGVSLISAPVTSILVFFSYDLLLLWTRSEDVAIHAAPTLSVLALSAMFNLMMHVPFMLQLAAGITWIALWNNAVSLILLMPFMYYLIFHYGIAGAGVAWAIFNFFYYLIVPQALHRYILPNEKISWIFQDTLPFMLVSVLVFGGINYFSPLFKNDWHLVLSIFAGCLFYFGICILMSPIIRNAVRNVFLRMR